MELSEPLKYIRLPFNLATLPDGWFNKYEINLLYQLVSACDGPILEIGPWVGRSSCVICHALSAKSQPQHFTSIDYFFESEAEWQERFGSSVHDKENADYYLNHINQPGGVMTSLKNNLDSRGFLDLVDIRRGDFRNQEFDTKFDLIFSDAMHGVSEIRKNIDATLHLLNPGGILACDDVAGQDHIDAITAACDFEWHFIDSQLFYGKTCIDKD